MGVSLRAHKSRNPERNEPQLAEKTEDRNVLSILMPTVRASVNICFPWPSRAGNSSPSLVLKSLCLALGKRQEPKPPVILGQAGATNTPQQLSPQAQAIEIRSYQIGMAGWRHLSPTFITLMRFLRNAESSFLAAVIKCTKAEESSLGISVDYWLLYPYSDRWL